MTWGAKSLCREALLKFVDWTNSTRGNHWVVIFQKCCGPWVLEVWHRPSCGGPENWHSKNAFCYCTTVCVRHVYLIISHKNLSWHIKFVPKNLHSTIEQCSPIHWIYWVVWSHMGGFSNCRISKTMVFNATKWSNDSNDWIPLDDFGVPWLRKPPWLNGESQPLPRACGPAVPLGRSTWVKNSDFLPSARYRGSKPKVPVTPWRIRMSWMWENHRKTPAAWWSVRWCLGQRIQREGKVDRKTRLVKKKTRLYNITVPLNLRMPLALSHLGPKVWNTIEKTTCTVTGILTMWVSTPWGFANAWISNISLQVGPY